MSVRAKFRVETITKTAEHGITVRMSAVHDPTIPEGLRFSWMSPTGSIVMFVTTVAAEEFFCLGDSYYVEITDAKERDAQKSRVTDPA
jgi:hypothetical protein